jgi:hypothetical protein
MTARRPLFRSLMPALFALSLAGVAAADEGVQVTAASAPAGTDARFKRALSQSIKTRIGETGLATKLAGYRISPALIELRRFIEPGQTRPRTVCVVALGLQDPQGGLVANVRGNAAGFGATQLDLLDAAARSAVDRLPETLSALQRVQRGARVASR